MGTHTLAPGTVLGRYELLLPIAQGGMATVWAARQRGSRGFSKTVAIKTILPNLSDDPTFEQMFLDEAGIASRIHHPNVAEILDLGEQDEVLYLVMEWVDGESLSTLSKNARKNGTDIPLRVGLKILEQASAGLHAAHELRDEDDNLLELVHRDISPQNLLVSSTGLVKLVDFGVAKAMGRSGETSAGQLKGKVPFMSPEQAKGAAVDRRTDVFALGILLYRVATGAHPFIDDNDIKTMRNIITRPPMPPRVKNPKISQDLERIILRALQKDPEKRYATALEMGNELKWVLRSEGGPVSEEDVATFVRSTMGERDRKRRAAIRDAALKMDEHGSITQGGPESVSGVMLTTTQTPPSALTGPEVTAAYALRASSPDDSIRGSLASAPSHSGLGSAPGLGGARASQASSGPVSATPSGLPSSPTLAAMASSPSASSPSRRTKVIAISLALVCGVSVGALAVFGNPKPPMRGTSTPVPASPPIALPSATAAALQSPTTESEPMAESSAGTDLSIDELPEHRAAGRPRTGKRVPAGAALPAAAGEVKTAAAEPKAEAKPAPTAKATSAVAMPAVQDPGF